MIVIFRNIIKEMYTEEELTLELLTFYAAWKRRYIREVNNSSPTKEYLFYTFDQLINSNVVTCSEAMGYGMLIFPMMSKFDSTAKYHFTKLYNFIKSYPSVYNKNLMAWQQIRTSSDEIVNIAGNNTSSATDGDIDISYGLLLADRLWSNSDKINYKAEALKRIQALFTNCVDKEDYSLTLGDWVLSSTNSSFKGITRSSDFILYSLKKFCIVDKKNHKHWKKVISRINTTIDYQLTRESKYNGLLPDFFKKVDGKFIAVKGKVLETAHDGDYYYNSCRIPWRYSMDIILNEAPITKQLSLLNNYIINKSNADPKNIVSGYCIANCTPGELFGENNDLSFVAPFLVLSLLQKDNEAWILSLWKHILSIPIEASTYYGNTLKLIAMIVATGHWLTPK